MKNIIKILCVFFCLILSNLASYADGDSATAMLQFTVPSYIKIQPVTSPVLTANITDRTGNLYAPLNTKFKVVTNTSDKKILYLKAHTITDSGYEPAMFSQGGQVYIAFANLAKIPTSSALANCKNGGLPKDSPGVVAYPVMSVSGAENKYIEGEGKYEVEVKNGVSYVNINVGSHVLRTSFAGNDPKGFYQAVLSLTEADI